MSPLNSVLHVLANSVHICGLKCHSQALVSCLFIWPGNSTFLTAADTRLALFSCSPFDSHNCQSVLPGKSVDCTHSSRRSFIGCDLTYHGLSAQASSILIILNSTFKCFQLTDHWHDVLVGSAVGFVLAYFSYRQYFPSLESPLSHRPYAPRIESEDESMTLPIHADPNSPQGDRRDSGGDDVELIDGTVKRPGPSRISDNWIEDVGPKGSRYG
jgi:hypothetical protein